MHASDRSTTRSSAFPCVTSYPIVVLVCLLLLLVHAAAFAVPGNNAFAGATVLAATMSGQVTGSTSGADKETGEPPHGYNVGGASVWYKWTAPANGSITFDTLGSAFDTLLGAYTGSSVSALTLATPTDYATNDDLAAETKSPSHTYKSRIKFNAVSGQTYYLAVDGYNAAQGNFILNWQSTPANDDFANATALTGAAGTTTGTCAGATREYQEESCTAVWYTWTAPGRGRVTFSTAGSDYAVGIRAYTGTGVSSLTAQAYNFDTSDFYAVSSGIRFPADTGVTYRIAIDAGEVDPRTGHHTLTWNFTAAPANDLFANAQVITGANGSTAGTNRGARGETPDEPLHAGIAGENSVWYKWTAPANGLVTFDTLGSALTNRLLAVYTGGSLASLSPVVAIDNNWQRLRFRATSGTIYYLAVDSPAGYRDLAPSEDTFTLHWQSNAAPANDDFANATVLPGAMSGSVNGTNVGATHQPGEADRPNIYNYSPAMSSVWYRWTAPSSGAVTFTATGAGFTPQIDIFTGTSVGALTEVTPHRIDWLWGGNGKLRIRAQAGTTYYLWVDGKFGEENTFTLAWATGPANDDLANAQTLTGANGTVTGSNAGATAEADEPNAWDYGWERATIWYRWTAPSTGSVFFDMIGSATPGMIYCYAGSGLATLNQLATGAGDPTPISFHAMSGTTYLIAILNTGGLGEGNQTLHWNMPPPPANDNFANAQTITGADNSVIGTTAGATTETSEPSDYLSTIWYKWTAPGDGRVQFTITNGDSSVRVYTGSTLSALSYRRSGGDHIAVASGNIFCIQVGVETGHTQGAITLHWHFDAAPANDDFAQAQVLTGNNGNANGTLLGATPETDEPTHDNGLGASPDASVWYKWTAPSDGRLTVTTNAAHLAAHTGTALASLSAMAYKDGWSLGWRVATGGINFPVSSGAIYYLAVDDRNEPDISLGWTFTAAPAHDDFTAAQVISGAVGSAAGTNRGATPDGTPDQPAAYHEQLEASVWYRWTAPATGAVTFDTAGSSFNNVLAVYTGSALTSLTLLQVNGGSATNRVSFKAQQGVTYRIVVNGVWANYDHCALGDITLNWNMIAGPPNDDFANAVMLTGTSGSTTGTNVHATHEPGEPYRYNQVKNGGKSVWYVWTAPHDGKVKFTVTSTDFYPYALAFTGTAVNALTPVIYNSEQQFTAVKGQTYHIMVDGEDSGDGAFTLNWLLLAPPSNDDFTNRQALTDATAIIFPDGTRQVTGTNVGAARETGEPNHDGKIGGASVWFYWTAPADGIMSFALTDSTFTASLAVYTCLSTPALAGLQPLASGSYGNFNGYWQNPVVTFRATAGTVYYLAIDGLTPDGTGVNGASEGDIILRWKSGCALSLSVSPSTFSESALTPAVGTVTLTPAPEINTWVTLTNTDTDLISMPGEVMIPAYETSVTFDIYAVDDYVDEDTRQTVITASNPTAISASKTVTVTDNDTAGFVVSPTGGVSTSETGESVYCTIVLTSCPTAQVTVSVTSNRTDEGRLIDPSTGNPTTGAVTLTFTPNNWSSAQLLTMQGVDDAVWDGDKTPPPPPPLLPGHRASRQCGPALQREESRQRHHHQPGQRAGPAPRCADSAVDGDLLHRRRHLQPRRHRADENADCRPERHGEVLSPPAERLVRN